MRITLILKNNKNILQNIFTYIFILTYTLNAPKINDLYMTKKVILKKNKGNNNKLKSIYIYIYFLTLNRGEWGILGKSRGAMAPLTPPPSAYGDKLVVANKKYMFLVSLNIFNNICIYFCQILK